MTRIEIVVDELVMRGLPSETARAVAAVLEARLTGLAGSRAALPARDDAYRRLPPVEASAGSPAELGDAVAGAVWDALAGGASR